MGGAARRRLPAPRVGAVEGVLQGPFIAVEAISIHGGGRSEWGTLRTMRGGAQRGAGRRGALGRGGEAPGAAIEVPPLLCHYCSSKVLVLFNNYVGLIIYVALHFYQIFIFSSAQKTNGGSLCFAYIYGCFLSGDDTYLCHYTLKFSPFYWSLVYRVLC
jgi:hypothetical protein